MPQLLESAASGARTPSLLVTSGMLAKDPFPAMFSLAASKAAQYSLVHSLHKEFEPKGVHCGLIVIGGTVSDDSKVTNARNIAQEAWNMSSQAKGKGSLEVMMTDPAYSKHVKNREQKR
jgi:short-subunit dehydrogenase